MAAAVLTLCLSDCRAKRSLVLLTGSRGYAPNVSKLLERDGLGTACDLLGASRRLGNDCSSTSKQAAVAILCQLRDVQQALQ